MPKVKTTRSKRPPEGYSEVQPTLIEFDNRLRDAEAASDATKKTSESLHEIFRIHHQKSRYVYDLYYKKKAISGDLYQWLLKNRHADANLIAKWKKQGYENLCCLLCIQARNTQQEDGSKDKYVDRTTCICRVPRAQLAKSGHKVSGCVACGCRGCASTD
ncbi:pre-mRNA-splicing factor Bud31p [Trichomonascus vanleenenianus]|uniref:U2 snRNP complex subunit BUD31 n=1 Tax=Trichomonascus vanleenenianus TaxID=2268995 RepID=UPI003ECB5C49